MTFPTCLSLYKKMWQGKRGNKFDWQLAIAKNAQSPSLEIQNCLFFPSTPCVILNVDESIAYGITKAWESERGGFEARHGGAHLVILAEFRGNHVPVQPGLCSETQGDGSVGWEDLMVWKYLLICVCVCCCDAFIPSCVIIGQLVLYISCYNVIIIFPFL